MDLKKIECEHPTSFIALYVWENVLSSKYSTYKLNVLNTTQLNWMSACVVNVIFKSSWKPGIFYWQKDSYEFERQIIPTISRHVYFCKESTPENLKILIIAPFNLCLSRFYNVGNKN